MNPKEELLWEELFSQICCEIGVVRRDIKCSCICNVTKCVIQCVRNLRSRTKSGSREGFMENSIIIQKKNQNFVSKFKQNDRENLINLICVY
jgi:hypothetical protein